MFLFVRQKIARIPCWWGDDCAVAVEEAVKSRAQSIRCVLRAGSALLHQVAQFRPRAGIEQVKRVVLERRVDSRITGQRFGTVGHRRVAQILQAMQRGQLEFEIALQIGLRILRRAALRNVNA